MQTLQADYFAAYRHLKLSRDAKGVLCPLRSWLRLRNTHPESPYTPTKGQSSSPALKRVDARRSPNSDSS